MGLINKLEAIATAIRNKTNTTAKLTLDEMPAMIESISGGGMVKEKPYINFYGFGGTLLHSYSLEDFNTLSSLPRVPDNIPGFKAIGWNKDIDSIKASGHHEDVGAIYEKLPDEVVVEELEEVSIENTKLYFHFEYPLTMSVYFRQNKANAVTLDWGDGTVDTSPSTYGNNNITMSHTYQKGDYALTFVVAQDATLSLGTAGTSINVIGTASHSTAMTPKLAALYKVEVCTRDTVLLNGVFRNIGGLKEVLISDHKTCTIPSYAFEYSQALTHVRLSALTTLIYDYAFRSCYALQDIVIPDGVTSIGAYSFQDCRTLSRIVIPPSVKTISNQVFQGCQSLKEVVLNEGLETIGSYVFNTCQHLESINLPTTLKTINNNTFNNCYCLKKIAWPKKATSLTSSSFYNCYCLQEVIIPEGVTTIQASAFSGCFALKYVAFPSSVKAINDNAFYNCFNLKLASFNQGLETLGASCFFNVYALKRIILPESLKTISSRPFQGVKSLEVYEPGEKFQSTAGIVTISNYKDNSFSLFEKQLMEELTSFKTAAFEYSTAYRELEIPDGITEIAPYAFRYNYILEKLKMPLNLLKVGSYAFSGNACLETIELPKTLTNVGNNAFDSSYDLKKMSFPSLLKQIDANGFSNCYSLKEVEIASNGLSLYGAVFSGCYSLDTIKLKTGVTNMLLGSSAFATTAIETLKDLPLSISIIGASAFQNCYCLKEADLSGFETGNNSNLNSMFYNCYSLKKVVMSKKFEAIGSGMFQNCYCLEEIEIPENVTVINSNAFYECRCLERIEFKGNKLETIYSSAFNACFILKSIHLPYTLKTIQTCFSNCYALHDVYFYSLTPPTGVTSIGSMADGYVIHVPKGYQSLYEAQFSGHKGHFEEFAYLKTKTDSYSKKLGLSANQFTLKNVFISSKLDEGVVINFTPIYEGNNIASFDSIELDENNALTISITRSDNVSYNTDENITILAQVEELGLETQVNVNVKFLDYVVVSEYEVTTPAGYEFVYNEDDEYYYSSNTGIHGSYALAKVRFLTTSGKLYVDCTGQGEANYDYGIVSKLDTVLSSSNTVDTGAMLQKTFYGLGTYTQTVEFDIEDAEEHFIYIKYRKDGSGNVGLDYMKFRIRFE